MTINVKKIIIYFFVLCFAFPWGMNVWGAPTFCNSPCCQNFSRSQSCHNSFDKAGSPLNCHKQPFSNCQRCCKLTVAENDYLYVSSTYFTKPFYHPAFLEADQTCLNGFRETISLFAALHRFVLPLFLQKSTFLLWSSPIPIASTISLCLLKLRGNK